MGNSTLKLEVGKLRFKDIFFDLILAFKISKRPFFQIYIGMLILLSSCILTGLFTYYITSNSFHGAEGIILFVFVAIFFLNTIVLAGALYSSNTEEGPFSLSKMLSIFKSGKIRLGVSIILPSLLIALLLYILDDMYNPYHRLNLTPYYIISPFILLTNIWYILAIHLIVQESSRSKSLDMLEVISFPLLTIARNFIPLISALLLWAFTASLLSTIFFPIIPLLIFISINYLSLISKRVLIIKE